jgi:hypothetical protein
MERNPPFRQGFRFSRGEELPFPFSKNEKLGTVVFHKFATPEKVQTHLISYALKDKLKHRCREYLERGFKRHSERSVKTIKSRHILTACFLGPWFQTFELPL